MNTHCIFTSPVLFSYRGSSLPANNSSRCTNAFVAAVTLGDNSTVGSIAFKDGASHTTTITMVVQSANISYTLPAAQGASGTSTTVLHGNAGAAPSYGAVNLAADVTAILPIANGGTALSAAPANGQLLIGNTGSSDFSAATLTVGAEIFIRNGPGSIYLAAPNVDPNVGVTTNATLSGTGHSIPSPDNLRLNLANPNTWTTTVTADPASNVTGLVLKRGGASDIFRVEASGGSPAVYFRVTGSGNIQVGNNSPAGNSHIHAGGASAAMGAAAGVTLTALTSLGANDIAGRLLFVDPGGNPGTDRVVITLSSSYSGTPTIVLSSEDAGSVAVQPYATYNAGSNAIVIGCGAPAAGQYTYDYRIISVQ